MLIRGSEKGLNCSNRISYAIGSWFLWSWFVHIHVLLKLVRCITNYVGFSFFWVLLLAILVRTLDFQILCIQISCSFCFEILVRANNSSLEISAFRIAPVVLEIEGRTLCTFGSVIPLPVTSKTLWAHWSVSCSSPIESCGDNSGRWSHWEEWNVDFWSRPSGVSLLFGFSIVFLWLFCVLVYVREVYSFVLTLFQPRWFRNSRLWTQ